MYIDQEAKDKIIEFVEKNISLAEVFDIVNLVNSIPVNDTNIAELEKEVKICKPFISKYNMMVLKNLGLQAKQIKGRCKDCNGLNNGCLKLVPPNGYCSEFVVATEGEPKE